ncbi:E3 ubiquitin-protein ligase TRIM71 [Stylophora pistillata]|uniref:E3 ubiquitin-protein ligase TRIM71 n=1 Tax=Stylophora pistillata TaxID=50429 RepID=A0A2B4R5L7_STYPI|nr:E3 ubiquitin-protein ligase TRIM71 [Stylophora pistillata]
MFGQTGSYERVAIMMHFSILNAEEKFKSLAVDTSRIYHVLVIKECHTTGVKCGNCDKSSRHSSYCFQSSAFWCDEYSFRTEEAASERKLQVKSLIESQKEKTEQKKNEIVELERLCNHTEVRADAVKRDIHNFTENMIAAIEAKTKEMLNKVELQQKESLECVRTQQCKKTKNSDSIGSFATFETVTLAHQLTAEGKGITEAIVGLQSNFLLTTKNTEGEQCYHERDCVMVEIKTQQGLDHDYATEVRVQHNKDGSYKVRYLLKDTGKCQLSVKANKEHIRGSPFTVEEKPRQFRPLLSFGKGGSSVGMFRCPYRVAVNERDELGVTDTNNYRVQVFSSDGTYLRSFGKKGDEQG